MPRKHKEVTKAGTKDKWKVQCTKEDKFETATLNNEEMIRRFVGPDDIVDLERMQGDFDAFPNIPGVKKGNTYAYSLPIRNAAGKIIYWVCGGAGPYACGG